MERKVCKVYVVGERPLLCNKISTDELGTTSKKGQVYDPLEESQKRLYLNKNKEICQPAEHFEGSLVKAATDFKFKGQKTYKEVVKAGVFIEPVLIPHLIPEWEIDSRSVVVQRSRIARHRPRFDTWELEFNLILTDDRLQVPIVKEIMINAGKYVGVGDYRPKYGLFTVKTFELIG